MGVSMLAPPRRGRDGLLAVELLRLPPSTAIGG